MSELQPEMVLMSMEGQKLSCWGQEGRGQS